MRLLMLIAIAALFLFTSPSAAQQPQPESCLPLPRAQLAKIQDKYEEVNTGAGLSNGGWMVQHWANPETGSWSITMSGPRGAVCLMAVGEGWRAVKPPVKGTAS